MRINENILLIEYCMNLAEVYISLSILIYESTNILICIETVLVCSIYFYRPEGFSFPFFVKQFVEQQKQTL